MLRYTVSVQFDVEPTDARTIQSNLDKLAAVGEIVESKAKSVKVTGKGE